MRNHMAARRNMVIIVVFLALLFTSPAAHAQNAATLAARDFENIMKAWEARDYGTLWEYGNNVSKSVYTKDYFIEKMSQPKPLTFQRAENVHINLAYPTLAYARADLVFIDSILNKRVQVRQFQIIYENGFFRAHLGDFLR